MAKQPNLEDYNDVAFRKAEFFKAYPEGSLQSECQFTTIGERDVAIVKAYAYRNPTDPRPGVGLAYEFIPGNTPFTKDSELQNAETAAWGRAIEATGASTSKKIASYEEVRNRTYTPEPKQQSHLSTVPTNAIGRAALTSICMKNDLPFDAVAVVFEDRFGKPPRDATNEELAAFVNLIEAGVVTINIQKVDA